MKVNGISRSALATETYSNGTPFSFDTCNDFFVKFLLIIVRNSFKQTYYSNAVF